MTSENRCKRAADGLEEVIFQMEAVDLNTLLDDDAQTFLEDKRDLEVMYLRYRRNERAIEQSKGGR